MIFKCYVALLFFLTLLAKPHPPSGEIAISDIGQDSTALSWNPPIDDQVPVDEYVIEIKGMFGLSKLIMEDYHVVFYLDQAVYPLWWSSLTKDQQGRTPTSCFALVWLVGCELEKAR